ncbi:hypothetical protein AMS68_002320 [Peltaster fructicola]|uniref:Methyltransferase domain-containing protein n=1 Tax=Peltaster fructicola TaxID=286661 RepID=A0A6H0XQ22_9PEZI|nr:hypothetical protein AMS68_002320 [Peltaster fructicola]
MALRDGSKHRWPAFIATTVGLLIVVGIFFRSRGQLPESATKYWPLGHAAQEAEHGFSLLPPVKQDAADFYIIALQYGSDKVVDHSYQDMYEKYLPKLRYDKIKLLEIGMGCDMSHGPGPSYHLWLEYLPNVELYFLENDAACAEQWAHKTTGATVITGNQADPAVLAKLVQEHGNDFDIIIDAGGRMMVQQQTSLEHLWKAVKPGGMYFCEDLQTSYWPKYGGGETAVAEGRITMMQYIYLMIEDLTWGARRIDFQDADKVMSIDCSREICSIFKRKG